MSLTNYIINKEFNNKTIKEYLEYYHLSKSKIKEIEVHINNQLCNLNHVLKKDDILTIHYDEEIDFILEDIKIDIIYEDDYLLIVNKPIGLLVHPDSKDKTNTLVNRVANYFKINDINKNVRYLHRIDIDTSGLVMFAKDILTSSYMNHLISLHKIKRTYLAICSGNLNEEQGVIIAPIGNDRHHNQRMRVSKTGKEAITYYNVIKKLKHNYSLVELVLKTGRTHQIRVHMKYLGHPLAGDILYGGSNKYIKRQALHSYKLDFIHPHTFKQIYLEAPIPNDMNLLIKND